MRPASERSGTYDPHRARTSAGDDSRSGQCRELDHGNADPPRARAAPGLHACPNRPTGSRGSSTSKGSSDSSRRSTSSTRRARVSLGRFRRFDASQPRERLSPRWVLFTANFDGDWGPYFGAFMEGMAEGVYDVWGPSIDYPGFPAADTANPLRDWLATRLPATQHYYAAYPHATTNDVRSALRVRREICSLAIDLETRRGAARDAAGSPQAFDDVTRGLRHCLEPVDPAPWSSPCTRLLPLRTGRSAASSRCSRCSQITSKRSGRRSRRGRPASIVPCARSPALTSRGWRCCIAVRSGVTRRRNWP